MATTQQIEAYSNSLIARGVVPDRMINSGRSRLAFILVQGFQNEHQGQLPRSDGEFRDWAAAPYWQNPGLRRYWPPGARDVKTDGTSNPAPWDWSPMGWPDGNGGNAEDYQNRTPWADVAPPAAAAPAPTGQAPAGTPAAATGASGSGTAATFLSGKVDLFGTKVDKVVVAAGAAGAAVLLLSRRR